MDELIKELERWVASDAYLMTEDNLYAQGYNRGQASARESVKFLIDLYGNPKYNPEIRTTMDSKNDEIKGAEPMKLWVARDKNGMLHLFKGPKPILIKTEGWWLSDKNFYKSVLPNQLFPEVTCENSPQEVELKLISDGK